MGFAAAQHKYASGAALTTLGASLTNNPATGSVVSATLFWYDGTNTSAGTVTVSDGSGNSYTVSPNSPSNANAAIGILYMFRFIATGTAHKTVTASWTTVSAAVALSIDEFSVSGGTAAFDQDAVGTGTTGTSINTPTVPVTSGTTNLLIAAAIPFNNGNSVDSPWTQVYASGDLGDVLGYRLAAGATAFAATQSASGGWDSIGMSFTFTPSATFVPRNTYMAPILTQ